MRYARFLLVALVSLAALVVADGEDATAFPGLGGGVFFSTTTIDAAHDVSPAPVMFGMACTSADLMTTPGTTAVPCAPRIGPAPPGPVPDAATAAIPDLGLNSVGGAFSDASTASRSAK
jgi:hypothetical protein